ncbi:hypothetical protein [uncultured Empedobacter sp.]|uniref:hypothetical protein n=1 Tax=uncultured Empedobacter sp. TaxID=410844 RepID=UPI0025F53ED2|nr:hypothetical protein [uncultured Empedobacter sp.]
MSQYYNEKICSLVEKLYISSGNSKERLSECQEKIISCYLASKTANLSDEANEFWNKFNEEYLSKINIYEDNRAKNVNLYSLLSKKGDHQ